MMGSSFECCQGFDIGVVLTKKESNSPTEGKVAASKTLMSTFYNIKKIKLASS